MCPHHRVNIFVSHWNFINHIGIFAAFHALGGFYLVVYREHFFRLGTAHGSACAVAAAVKTLGVAFAAHNKTSGPHTARNNAQLARPGTDCAFAGNKHLLAKVGFLLHIVVVAVHGLQVGFKRFCDHLAQRTNSRLHHHLTVQTGKLLRPAHAPHIVTKILRAFFKVGQVFVGQVTLVQFSVFFSQFDKVNPNGVTHPA